ncbi:2d6dca7f-804c-4513-be5c-373be058fbf6 [Thermothielavioides terrestris]|uniref:Biogenesis of lysosome-related organelles complex 1 subunit CNL1 n=1 Tax=Thermothielavioides terrestris TaxID=2587410 RepID=A0A3S4B1Z2_9PEZI|nr:2d6dca7f-804c-4513-be5c-373be058fbf6 [Thermothielavioides terrestris]
MSQQQQDASNAVPDTQLGLTEDEIQLLRHGQQAVAAAGGSTSSRAASRASSQGLLMVDTSSLTALGRHFDRVMQSIQQRLDYLMQQSEIVTLSVYDRAGNLIDNADAEIARYHEIMAQIDELELDFDRISHIREIVHGFRQRAEELERELERAGAMDIRAARENAGLD